MEFKSSFPWQLYFMTAIAQAAGMVFFVHNLTLPLIIFAIADLYVLMKIFFKTKYILDARSLTAKRFLMPDDEIEYSSIVEIKPTTVFSTHGFGRLYRNQESYNFFNIVYTVRSMSSISGRSRKVFIAHPKKKEAFFTELISHVKNAEVQFEFPTKTDEKKEKKKTSKK